MKIARSDDGFDEGGMKFTRDGRVFGILQWRGQGTDRSVV